MTPTCYKEGCTTSSKLFYTCKVCGICYCLFHEGYSKQCKPCTRTFRILNAEFRPLYDNYFESAKRYEDKGLMDQKWEQLKEFAEEHPIYKNEVQQLGKLVETFYKV